MANTQALCSQFKVDVLNGYHAFGATVTRTTATTFDSYKAALYAAAGTYNASTTNYQVTNEVGASGSYAAGGVAVTWISASQNNPTGTTNASSTAYSTLSASIVVTSFTAASFDAVLIYNATASRTPANVAVSVHTFGTQSITAGTFTLTMPTNDQTTGLIRIT